MSVEKISCVYGIRSNRRPDKLYVGSSCWFQHRKWRHLNNIKHRDHHNVKIENHAIAYGIDDLKFFVIELVADKKQLVKREQFFINILNPSFNINKIATNRTGRKHSEETKRKIGEGNKGKIMSAEARVKISKAALGRKRSAEERLQMSISRKGKKQASVGAEGRKRMSEARKLDWVNRRLKLIA